MNVLGLDSATGAGSAAWWRRDRIVARRFAIMVRGQSEALVTMAAAVAAEAEPAAQYPFDRLDLIAITVGPGAFTGLRIGLAAAQGLAVATGAALVGVTTLEAVAAGLAPERRTRHLAVALETKRNDIYWQVFDPALMPLTEPAAVSVDMIRAALAGYDGVTLLGDAAGRIDAGGIDVARVEGPGLPDAAVIAALAAARGAGNGQPAVPLYLRPPDVTMAPKPGVP